VSKIITHIAGVVTLFLVCSVVNANTTASITITSETQKIYLGDSVILDIESTGLLDPLDVDQLKSLPDFLRETTGTRIAVVDGKVVEIAIRRMEFIPLKTGTLPFGPLSGESVSGAITSNAVAIEVQAALNTQWQPGEADLQSELVYSNPQPMVGEQIVLDITLRHTHQIANEAIKMPEFTEFDVLPVFEQRRTIEGDGEWRQIAWRYLLHPKRSGKLGFKPIQWTGTMIKSRSQRGEFNYETTPDSLQVSSAPVDRPDWWLPATSVKLSDAWSKEVITLSAGDEIIRTITLSATNVLSSQLPDIAPYPTRALTSTLIRTSRDHELVDDHTIATGVFEYRMVAQSPIPVFLDTVRVPWWNVTTSTHEEAILPARRINVGLPDRADLLADLAINQSGWSRLVLKLRSFAAWQPILISLCVIVIFLGLFPLIRDGVHQHLRDTRMRKTLRKLEHLRINQNWAGLYDELNKQALPKGLIKTDSPEFTLLMQALQNKLFSNANPTATVLLKKIQLPFSAQENDKRKHNIKPL